MYFQARNRTCEFSKALAILVVIVVTVMILHLENSTCVKQFLKRHLAVSCSISRDSFLSLAQLPSHLV